MFATLGILHRRKRVRKRAGEEGVWPQQLLPKGELLSAVAKREKGKEGRDRSAGICYAENTTTNYLATV